MTGSFGLTDLGPFLLVPYQFWISKIGSYIYKRIFKIGPVGALDLGFFFSNVKTYSTKIYLFHIYTWNLLSVWIKVMFFKTGLIGWLERRAVQDLTDSTDLVRDRIGVNVYIHTHTLIKRIINKSKFNVRSNSSYKSKMFNCKFNNQLL